MKSKEIKLENLKEILIKVAPHAEFWIESETTDLIEANLLDSLNILELIQALEEKYDFVFNMDDLRTHFFQNLNSIMDLLVSKYGFLQISE